jgi:hypothetical protein
VRKTPEQIRQEEAQNRLYPELKLAREAGKIHAGNPAEWRKVNAKYKAAEETIDSEIIQIGRGKNVADSLMLIRANTDAMQFQLRMALDDFKNEKRRLPIISGQSEAQRDADEKIVRGLIKGNPTANPALQPWTRNDMESALLGNHGPVFQRAMLRVLTPSERESYDNMVMLAQKSQEPALIRMQHAIDASEYGFRHNDQKAKDQAKSIVESIAAVDPDTFKSSPEILGALKQADAGKQIDVATGRAAAVAFSEAAKTTIDQSGNGIADIFVPGSSVAMESVGLSLLGEKGHIWKVPFLGGAFGGSAESNTQVINQLAAAQMKNAGEAKAEKEQLEKDAHTQLRGLLGDITGTVATYASEWGLKKGIQYLAGEAPLPLYVKAPLIGLSLLMGAETNNLVSGRDDFKSSMLRNAVASGSTFLSIKEFQRLPLNQNLSEGVLARFGKAGEISGKQLAAQLEKGGMEDGISFLGRHNPMNFIPLKFAPLAEGASKWNPLSRLQYVGFGGERTAQAFADGVMTLGEYKARQTTGKILGSLTIGYGFGASNRGAELATGGHIDGKKYHTVGDYLHDMHTAGLNSALATAVTIPYIVAPSMRCVLPERLRSGITAAVTNGFEHLPGVNAASATSALGTASLLYARPLMDTNLRVGHSIAYTNAYEQARKELHATQHKTRR